MCAVSVDACAWVYLFCSGLLERGDRLWRQDISLRKADFPSGSHQRDGRDEDNLDRREGLMKAKEVTGEETPVVGNG